MDKLKPCPFCGYKGVEILADDNKYLYYRYFSQCQRCGAGAKRGHTKEDAVKEWNRRADNGDKQKGCSYRYCPNCGANMDDER